MEFVLGVACGAAGIVALVVFYSLCVAGARADRQMEEYHADTRRRGRRR